MWLVLSVNITRYQGVLFGLIVWCNNIWSCNTPCHITSQALFIRWLLYYHIHSLVCESLLPVPPDHQNNLIHGPTTHRMDWNLKEIIFRSSNHILLWLWGLFCTVSFIDRLSMLDFKTKWLKSAVAQKMDLSVDLSEGKNRKHCFEV